MAARSRISLLALLLVGLSLGLAWLLHHESNPSEPGLAPSTESRQNKVTRVVESLESELLDGADDSLENAWYATRAFGPKTPNGVLQHLIRARLEMPATSKANLPHWIGTDPKLALSATLLESGEALEQAAPEATHQETPPDAFTLAWRVELEALRRRARAQGTEASDLARLCEHSLGLLERMRTTDSLARPFLAAALFRAMALAPDVRLEARARRAFAKLFVESRVPTVAFDVAATRVEALSAFLLWQQSQGLSPGSPTLAGLESLRDSLIGLAEEPHDRAAASAAVRALRLSKAVLR